jgi:2-phosphoglycerate kinase
MIYLVGGVAKSGKSLIAKDLLKNNHISYFPTDMLMMGLSNTIKGFTINPDVDRDEEVATKLEPILFKMISTAINNNDEYLFEGVHIRPSLCRKLMKQYPDKVKAVFLIYDEIDTSVKVDELITHVKSKYKTWLDLFSGEKFVEVVEILKQESLQLKKECQMFDLPYIEIKNIIEQKQEILKILFTKE